MNEVRISVIAGVAYVDEVPPGVVVRVRDYDDPGWPERDENGVRCNTFYVPWTVEQVVAGYKVSDEDRASLSLARCRTVQYERERR